MTNTEGRLAALEHREEIRQLAARYALALDSRDLGALVELFVEDVRSTDRGVGRDALPGGSIRSCVRTRRRSA